VLEHKAGEEFDDNKKADINEILNDRKALWRYDHFWCIG